jgi:probable phosphoglycerate mutase
MRTMLSHWLAADRRKNILLLRHGQIETAANEKRFIGQIDLPLSAVGKAQAAYWQSYLATLSFGAVVASPLSRCLETARIVAGGKCEIRTISELREIGLGQWEGMPISEVKRRWPDAYRQRGLDMAGFRPPDGENFLDLKKRVVPAFETTVEKSVSPVLVVTHAGVIRMLLCHILGMPIENLFRINLGYGALALVELNTGGYRIQALNLLPL